MVSKANNFICPSCGADMQVNSSAGILHCGICNRNDEIYTEDEEIVDYSFDNVMNDPENSNWGVNTNMISCGKCKSSFIFPEDRTPSICAFCGSQSLTVTDPSLTMRPDYLVPFKNDINKSVSILTNWIKRKPLAPRPLKKELKGVCINGSYIPYWVFESTTNSKYTGQAGDTYKDNETSTSTVKGKTETKTKRVSKIRWRFVSGSYDLKYKDILYNDSLFNQKILKRLEPFKLNELIKYEPRLIEGFAVERYKTGIKAVWERVRDFMRKSIQHEIYNTIQRGSNIVGKINISTKYTDIKYRLLLLPVWIASFGYKGKIYTAYINGQTGVILGKSPKSFLKILIAILVIAAVLAALYFFLLSPLLILKK